MSREPFGKRRMLMDKFDDDEIWENPEKSWRQWARQVDANPQYIKKTFQDHGWERRAKQWVKAPCRLCYSTTDAEYLTDDRCCVRCQNPDRDFYEKELRAFLARNPNFSSYIERSL